jgi:hypothetical protein
VIIQVKKGGSAGVKKANVPGEIEPVEIGFPPVATVNKSMVAPPKRNAEWDLYHTKTENNDVGIDIIESTVSVALRSGIITQRGAWYDLWEESYQGRTALVDFLKGDEQRIEKLREELFKDKEK